MQRKRKFYEKYIKRTLDIVFSILAVIALSGLFIVIAVIVRIKMGKPVLFKQVRPGMIDPKSRKERLFCMYKFRTMKDARDEQGNLLPDEQRLSKFGRMLRATSLDELPELFNIIKGDMSIIGPRPQLIRDMVFMSDEIRMRHTAKPGLSGLAQVNGRNAITWEQKFDWDLKYIQNVSFANDLTIFLLTIKKIIFREESFDELDVTADYGDYLMLQGKVSLEEYKTLQELAKRIEMQKT